MNMFVPPLAVRFVSLPCAKVKEALDTQKGLFDTLKALTPSRHQKDKRSIGGWFTNTMLLSKEGRQQKNTIFLEAHELLANNYGMLEALHEYVKEGGTEKPSLEIQEAMYFFWNGERQEAQEIEFQEELSEPAIEPQESLPEQEIEAEESLSEQTAEAQKPLLEVANTHLALKQKIQRPHFAPETMGLIAKVKQGRENTVAQANKPKSNVEKVLTSPMFVATTNGIIGGLTGLTHHLINIGLLTGTPFLVSGIPIIAGLVGLSLIISFAYFSSQYNANTDYARELDAKFFSPLIESLDAMLSEILANTRTILGLQNNSIEIQNEVKQDMRTGVAALNEMRATTTKTAATLSRTDATVQSTSERVRNLQTEVQDGFDAFQEHVQTGVKGITGAIAGLTEAVNTRPIIDNRQQHITYNVQQFIDPRYLPLAEQQRLLAQGSSMRPAITLSGEDSAEVLVDSQPRRQRQDSLGSVPDLTFYASSPESSSSSTFEGEDRSFALDRGSSYFKGKGRAEPTIFEEHSIEELLSSDSESESDAVLTVEARAQLKARAQRKAEKNAKLRAFALQFEEQQKKINKQAAILNALGVNVN